MHACALEPGADHHFTAGLHHAGRGAEALFVELWISHAVSIVPDVVDTFPCLFVLACVAMQRFDQGFQAAPIELGFSFDGTEIYFGQTIGVPEIWTIPTLGGAPKHLASGVTVTPSADGQSLFFVKPDGRIVRIPKSGPGEDLIYSMSGGSAFGIHTYPDGKSLLITSAGQQPGTTTFLRLDLSTHQLQNLGDLPDTSRRISWAAPGKTVYVSRALNGITNLWEYTLADHSLQQVTFGAGPDRAPMADPAGKGIYFINGKATGALTLYRVASKQFSDIVTEDASQPTLSNDGRHLAYVTTPELNKSELWVSDLAGNNRLKLASSGLELETLAWSNDASKFLFADGYTQTLKLFVIDADGTHLQQLTWSGNAVGFAIWEPGDKSIVLGGLNHNKTEGQNWRISLDGSPATLLYDGCGMAVDISPDHKFIIGSDLWGEHPGIYQYSIAEKKCTALKPGLATFFAMYADDGKSFLYSVAALGQTTIFHQPWRNGTPVGFACPRSQTPLRPS